MAPEHNIFWVPHSWNTAVGLATDLHLVASVPVARYYAGREVPHTSPITSEGTARVPALALSVARRSRAVKDVPHGGPTGLYRRTNRFVASPTNDGRHSSTA
jgi:hypothetical protein